MNTNRESDQDPKIDESPEDRTISGRPSDPNRLGADVKVPPGVSPSDVIDPGNATPGAPPVDNRSGQ